MVTGTAFVMNLPMCVYFEVFRFFIIRRTNGENLKGRSESVIQYICSLCFEIPDDSCLKLRGMKYCFDYIYERDRRSLGLIMPACVARCKIGLSHGDYSGCTGYYLSFSVEWASGRGGRGGGNTSTNLDP